VRRVIINRVISKVKKSEFGILKVYGLFNDKTFFRFPRNKKNKSYDYECKIFFHYEPELFFDTRVKIEGDDIHTPEVRFSIFSSSNNYCDIRTTIGGYCEAGNINRYDYIKIKALLLEAFNIKRKYSSYEIVDEIFEVLRNNEDLQSIVHTWDNWFDPIAVAKIKIK
jgi:hypothetical protein